MKAKRRHTQNKQKQTIITMIATNIRIIATGINTIVKMKMIAIVHNTAGTTNHPINIRTARNKKNPQKKSHAIAPAREGVVNYKEIK